MPKGKRSDDDGEDYEKLRKKLKKIEKKLRRGKKERHSKHRQMQVLSSLSCSPDESTVRCRSGSRDRSPPNIVSTESNKEQMPIRASILMDNGEVLEAQEVPQDVPMEDVNIAATDNTLAEIDPSLLEILGADPSVTNIFGKDIQKDIAVRLEYTATTGLSKEDRKSLTERYLIPSNCKLINAPTLNPEIKAALSETVLKRDKVIESKQKILASALASLGEAMSLLLSAKEKNTDLFRLLVDTGRMMGDCQHNDTIARRNFIIYSVKKEMKESLQNAKIDEFLFGSALTDALRAAKAINKSGSDLKIPAPPKPVAQKKNWPSSSKNWRGYYPSRKAPPSTTKPWDTTTTSATKSQRGASSRTWQPPPGPRARR